MSNENWYFRNYVNYLNPGFLGLSGRLVRSSFNWKQSTNVTSVEVPYDMSLSNEVREEGQNYFDSL